MAGLYSSQWEPDFWKREFHPFARLPYEIRVQIWKENMSPRLLELRPSHQHLGIFCNAVLPAELTTCRESRAIFSESYPQCFGSALLAPRTRVNFELDTVFLCQSADELIDLFLFLISESELRSLRRFAINTSDLYLDPIYRDINRLQFQKLQNLVAEMMQLTELIMVFEIQHMMDMGTYTLDDYFVADDDMVLSEEFPGFPGDGHWVSEPRPLPDVTKEFNGWTEAALKAVYGWRGRFKLVEGTSGVGAGQTALQEER